VDIEPSALAMSTSVMNRLRDLERELARRMSESRKKDEYIARLEHRLDERDASVRHLRNEIDKFRQVVRPLTHHIMAIQMSADDLVVYGNSGGGGGCCNGGDHHGHAAGSSFKGRPTRQAISAEPLRTTDPLPIVKVPKSSKWVSYWGDLILIFWALRWGRRCGPYNNIVNSLAYLRSRPELL